MATQRSVGQRLERRQAVVLPARAAHVGAAAAQRRAELLGRRLAEEADRLGHRRRRALQVGERRARARRRRPRAARCPGRRPPRRRRRRRDPWPSRRACRRRPSRSRSAGVAPEGASGGGTTRPGAAGCRQRGAARAWLHGSTSRARASARRSSRCTISVARPGAVQPCRRVEAHGVGQPARPASSAAVVVEITSARGEWRSSAPRARAGPRPPRPGR